MLSTIPFKRHSVDDKKSSKAKRQPSGKKNAMQRQSSSKSEHVAQTSHAIGSFKLRPWMAVVFVLVIALAGIVILRYSRASNNGSVEIPVSMFDIQNKVTSLLAEQSAAEDELQTSGYSEFHYAPVTDKAVAKVVYYLDNEMVSSSTKSPYSFVFDTSRQQNGSFTLTAVAFDATNTPVAATQKDIVIDNSGGILQGAKNLVTYPWYALFNL